MILGAGTAKEKERNSPHVYSFLCNVLPAKGADAQEPTLSSTWCWFTGERTRNRILKKDRILRASLLGKALWRCIVYHGTKLDINYIPTGLG